MKNHLVILVFVAVMVTELCAARHVAAPDRMQAFSKALTADPDCYRNVSLLIKSNGYPVQEYQVTTEDGYILGVQRIPGPKGFIPTPARPSASSKVAFLQHGILSSAADFVINKPSESLAYILADAGYDVWLGNVRGNTYSKRHKTLDPSSKQFWQFSFDEFIEYDIPAMIDFALNVTGQDGVYYIGHSQGTTVLFGLLASRPDYHSKIKAFAAMGPVANVTSVTSPIRYLAPFANDVEFILDLLGEDEFLPSNSFMKFVAESVCRFHFTEFVCEDALFLLCGADSKQLNATRLPVYACHSPAGTSVRNVVHFAQQIRAHRFQKFDFGESENIKKYGQKTPPEYDVRKVSAPVGLFWAQNDWLADPTDVAILEKMLPNLQETFRIPNDNFNHVDFLFGIQANSLAYAPLMTFLSKH